MLAPVNYTVQYMQRLTTDRQTGRLALFDIRLRDKLIYSGQLSLVRGSDDVVNCVWCCLCPDVTQFQFQYDDARRSVLIISHHDSCWSSYTGTHR